ncbi:hypothetical protein AGR4B_pAt20535 [Agrobacterium tumefaciens str. CFBP 5621]|nr:hypothetical protein AGR4B_pAt20535 [Agrobacterium tumefaciens str. CFBP 5621]
MRRRTLPQRAAQHYVVARTPIAEDVCVATNATIQHQAEVWTDGHANAGRGADRAGAIYTADFVPEILDVYVGRRFDSAQELNEEDGSSPLPSFWREQFDWLTMLHHPFRTHPAFVLTERCTVVEIGAHAWARLMIKTRSGDRFLQHGSGWLFGRPFYA